MKLKSLELTARWLGTFPAVVGQSARPVAHLLRRGQPRSAYAHLWTRLVVREEGPGLLDPLHRRLPQLAPYPRYLEVEITTRCNKRCIFCEHTHWDDERSRDMPWRDFLHLLDQFPNLRWINLAGEGSPFLHPDFLAMLGELRRRSTFILFVDHLDDLKPEAIDALVQLPVNRLEISMDGATKETYEAIKVGCRFDRVIENVERLLHAKERYRSPLPTINFRYVVCRENLHEVVPFLHLVAELGTRARLGADTRVDYTGLLEFDENRHLAAELDDATVAELTQRSRELGIPVSYSHPTGDVSRSMSTCTAWTEPFILIDGTVVPCCAVMMSNQRTFLRSRSLGNLFERSFRELWESPIYRRYRTLVPDPQAPVPVLCRGCRAFDTREREERYGVWDYGDQR